MTHAAARHFGLDWLRIAAFGLLIAYHVAMVFAPWPWVVKWPQTYEALVVPMALLTPWRLPLLFAVSGFASRRLLDRSPSLEQFVRERSMRLLVPLAFGMLVLLPPELWVRAKLAGDPMSLPRYWLSEYWDPSPAYGIAFPAWEHLWFVVYLWTYTMLLGALVAWRGAAPVQALAERVASGGRMLWLPIALLGTAKLALMFVVPETHGLTRDWSGHAEYVPFYLFGFALGGSAPLWRSIRERAAMALPLAMAAGSVVAAMELAFPGAQQPPHLLAALERLAQVAMAWAMLIVLLAAADRWLNRDHRWRARLAEAVFPAYLIHHPVLVVSAWLLRPSGLPAPLAFAVLLAIVAAACAGFYLLARQTPWLAPLAGLSRPRGPRMARVA